MPGRHGARRVDWRMVPVLLVMIHLSRPSVVAEKEYQGVLFFAYHSNLVHQPADLAIHTVDHRGVDGHFKIPIFLALHLVQGRIPPSSFQYRLVYFEVCFW